jgi:hypothetical protein
MLRWFRGLFVGCCHRSSMYVTTSQINNPRMRERVIKGHRLAVSGRGVRSLYALDSAWKMIAKMTVHKAC